MTIQQFRWKRLLAIHRQWDNVCEGIKSPNKLVQTWCRGGNQGDDRSTSKRTHGGEKDKACPGLAWKALSRVISLQAPADKKTIIGATKQEVAKIMEENPCITCTEGMLEVTCARAGLSYHQLFASLFVYMPLLSGSYSSCIYINQDSWSIEISPISDKGKGHCLPFKDSNNHAALPFELIHSDVKGPVPIQRMEVSNTG